MHTQARARGRRYSLRTPRRPAERPAEGRSPADGPMIHPRRGMSQMSDGQTPGNPDTPSGLRRAMEDRLTSLRQAEERLQREQAALQEQAKVVFAEREARLARREKELAKREAALAVNEGIAGHAPALADPELQEREQAIAAREAAVAQLTEELEAREQAVSAQSATKPSGGSAADRRRVAELEETVAALEEQLRAAASPDTARERSVDEHEADLKDREHRAKK